MARTKVIGINDDLDDETAGSGHNGGESLKSYIERIERLELQKAILSADIKQLYTDAVNAGFSKSALKQVVKIRAKNIDHEQRQTVNTYLRELGDLPLFAHMAQAA